MWNFHNIRKNFPPSPPPAKRHRGYGIDLDSSSSSDEDEEPNRFFSVNSTCILLFPSRSEPFRLLESRSSRIRKFSVTDHIYEFEVATAIAYPEQVFRQILADLLNSAIEKSENETGRKAFHFIYIIDLLLFFIVRKVQSASFWTGFGFSTGFAISLIPSK
jgi:hypothetical protein